MVAAQGCVKTLSSPRRFRRPNELEYSYTDVCGEHKLSKHSGYNSKAASLELVRGLRSHRELLNQNSHSKAGFPSPARDADGHSGPKSTAGVRSQVGSGRCEAGQALMDSPGWGVEDRIKFLKA